METLILDRTWPYRFAFCVKRKHLGSSSSSGNFATYHRVVTCAVHLSTAQPERENRWGVDWAGTTREEERPLGARRTIGGIEVFHHALPPLPSQDGSWDWGHRPAGCWGLDDSPSHSKSWQSGGESDRRGFLAFISWVEMHGKGCVLSQHPIDPFFQRKELLCIKCSTHRCVCVCVFLLPPIHPGFELTWFQKDSKKERGQLWDSNLRFTNACQARLTSKCPLIDELFFPPSASALRSFVDTIGCGFGPDQGCFCNLFP